MVELHRHIKDYIKNNYSIQYYDKSYYTESGELIAKPSTYLNDLLDIDSNTVDEYNMVNGNKIVLIAFDLTSVKENPQQFYIDGFFKKLFSNTEIVNGIHSGCLKILFVVKDTLCDFKDTHKNPNTGNGIIKPEVTLEEIFTFATQSLRLSNSSLIFLSDNLFMNTKEYQSRLPGLISHTLNEYSYVKSNYQNRTNITKYIDNINKLSDTVVNIKNIDTPYNFILFKYLVESGNIDKVFLKNTKLDLYEYPQVKDIFDRGLKYCKRLKYTHLEKYLNFTVDDYESLIKLSKEVPSYQKEDVYDKSVFTIIYNIIESSTNLNLPLDVFDAITNHHPIVLIGPKRLIAEYNRMGYRRSFFMHRDKLMDEQPSDKSIPHFLRDLDSLFNDGYDNLKNIIMENKDILEYNNNFLYNLSSTDFILTKIASKLVIKSHLRNESLYELLTYTYNNRRIKFL